MSDRLSERWERLERLYHAARERPAAERPAFLAEACGDDAALRHDVESLLSQDQSDGFLRTVASKSAESPTNTSAGVPFPDGRLRVYEILGHIGAGGMGEVYRARDTTLGRDVAIKVLPRCLSDDPGRRARLEREARVLAALSHPHIAQIYGFEEFDGGHALAMEFVEGDTLDEMIGDRMRRSGALPVAKALALARQIADALDAAHEKGIVHRDLKPSNIKITHAGVVKVLDFGLAKAVEPAVAVAAITTEISRQPVILGTVPYMSPEQVRGEPVDKRADIWAFGCVLFEMLTGHAPFEGDTASDTLLRILSRDPDWASLPAGTPRSVRTLLERCLRKDPHRRLHDIADARIELDDVERLAGVADVPTRLATTRRERLAWAISGVLAVSVAVTALLYRRGAPATAEPFQQVEIDPPPSSVFQPSDFAISPDGQQIAVVAPASGTSVIWVRSVAGPPWRQLSGTEGSINPFWKPDSQSIGFFARKNATDRARLMTVKVADGSVTPVCELPEKPRPPYGAWSSRGVIVFSADVSGSLQQVADTGGESKAVTQPDGPKNVHRSPSFLPDGDHFLYLAQTGAETGTTNELRVGSLSSFGKTDSLGPVQSNAVYAAGYLLFVKSNGQLAARPFDVDSRHFTGGPRTLAEDVAVITPHMRAQFSASTTGRLLYGQNVPVVSRLTWFDREGQPVGTVGDPGDYWNLNLNRDDRRLLVSRVTPLPGQQNVDIWLYDLSRAAAPTRLTFDAATETDPAWSPDESESQIAFNAFDPTTIVGRQVSLFLRSSKATGDNTFLTKAPELSAPEWSPDGRFLMFTQRSAAAPQQRHLWTIDLSGDRTPASFLNTPGSNEADAVFSPDGHWIAYEADYSGRLEIYVCPFPRADKRTQIPISTNGGRRPRWRGDEIFFLALDGRMMAAKIETAKGSHAVAPRYLFQTQLKDSVQMRPYAVTKDGQRFLMPVLTDSPRTAPVTVLLDWPARLAK